jgi:hypothetical protein
MKMISRAANYFTQNGPLSVTNCSESVSGYNGSVAVNRGHLLVLINLPA